MKPPKLLTLGAMMAAVLLAITDFSVSGAGSAELDEADFRKLFEQLQPPAKEDEAWRNLPWKLSVLEARDLAAKEKKPVYMLVRSGHPLGCV